MFSGARGCRSDFSRGACPLTLAAVWQSQRWTRQWDLSDCTLRHALLQGFRLLGGSSFTHLGPEDLAANAGEDLADTARLLSHVVDCIVVSTLRSHHLTIMLERTTITCYV
jgi:hypothetical protein